MKEEFGVEFKRYAGRKKIGSTYYELSEQEYDLLNDLLKSVINKNKLEV